MMQSDINLRFQKSEQIQNIYLYFCENVHQP